MRKIAISDIHGCNRTFLALLEKTGFSQGDELFLLGDYIDRGPDSKGVIDTILRLRAEGYSVRCIKGNHEEMLLKSWRLNDERSLSHWVRNGGDEALRSFGAARPSGIPPLYREFISKLPLYIEDGNHLLVHAGLNFTTPEDPLSLDYSMLWIRDWHTDVNYKWLGDRYIIHGHTPTRRKDILKMFDNFEKNRYINIDAGCCFKIGGFDSLCAFDMTNREIYFQENID